MLLSLTFHNPTSRVRMFHDQTLLALTAEMIDAMIVETTGGTTDEITDETLAMMLQVTTAEEGRTPIETEVGFGLEMINDCTATTCTLALVAVDFDD